MENEIIKTEKNIQEMYELKRKLNNEDKTPMLLVSALNDWIMKLEEKLKYLKLGYKIAEKDRLAIRSKK